MSKWVDRFQILVAVITVGFVIALFAVGPEESRGGSGSGEAVVGADVFSANCASCHGPDGDGGVGPQLSGGAVVESVGDPAAIAVVVTDGRGGMPSYSGRLSTEEIDAVAKYVTEF